MTKQTENVPSAPVTIDESGKAIEDAEQSKSTESRGKSSQSSAHQVIQLAKNFALDGSLLPPEKQMPLADRVAKRARNHAQRKQLNLEAIIVKTISYCSSDTIAERVDPDWFSQYIELAQGVSQKTMQELWAKILAREVSQPGSFSVKTLKVFQQLSVHDAKLLAKATAQAMRDKSAKQYRVLSGSYQVPSLFNTFDKKREQKIDLGQQGLSYSDILTLAENSLLFSQEAESARLSKGQELAYVFQGKNLILQASKNNVVVQFYKFTPSGSELARLISDNFNQVSLNALTEQLAHHFNSRTS